MSQFLEELKSELHNAWEERLLKTRFWQATQSGDLGPQRYAAFLRETYHYTRRSALIQSSTIPHFQIENRGLVRTFLKHAYEEESHYKICIKDLENLGYSASELTSSKPLPETEGYLGFIFNQISYVNPISYLGYLYNLEFLAIKVGPTAIEGIMKSVGERERCYGFLKVHAHEDIDHIEELDEVINSLELTKKEKEQILYTGRTAAILYANMIEASFENPWVKS